MTPGRNEFGQGESWASMICAIHQPIFLPWPGFFYKAVQSDCMILLDDVQYPTGRSWLNRNRLKNEQGELWLAVPVWKKGRGLQTIRDVEVCYDRGWREKHLRSIRQNYAHAPYFGEYYEAIQSIFRLNHALLIDLNLDLIRFFWQALSLKTEVVLQSALGVSGRGTDLLVKLCRRVGAGRLSVFPIAEKYIDAAKMKDDGIELDTVNFHPPVYPQLWREFIYNLSILDMLLNCGPKSREILARR
jgi:hypothetical protein